MATLDVGAVTSLVVAIDAGASESAAAFARTFGTDITIAVGKSGEFDTSLFSPEFWQKGLALRLESAGQGVAILIPSTTGLIPAWCEAPDATGKSKLATFAQEWGMNMLPDEFFPDVCEAAVITNLAEAIKEQTKLGAAPGYVELLLTSDGATKSALVVWALCEPQALLRHIVTPPAVTAANANTDTVAPLFTPPSVGQFLGSGAPFSDGRSKTFTLEDLPGFSHSLLKVTLPVAVVLARKREPIKKILELGIGSIIQFDKSCDEMIELEIDRTVVATGEAVKVGEMFGLRVSGIRLPSERFRMVEVRRDGEYATPATPHQIIGKAPIRSLEPVSTP